MVEDIVVASEDNSLERMSQEYTGFKKFLFGSLEALDINVSDYIGDIKYKQWSYSLNLSQVALRRPPSVS